MSEQPLRFNVGQPGGPQGPFWSIVASNGNVVALQITTEAYARRIAELLTKDEVKRQVAEPKG